MQEHVGGRSPVGRLGNQFCDPKRPAARIPVVRGPNELNPIRLTTRKLIPSGKSRQIRLRPDIYTCSETLDFSHGYCILTTCDEERVAWNVQRASSEFLVRPWLRRFVAGFSLANYLLLLVGIPLPTPVSKDSSRPFPCQHHRCGCASADQCWRHCCCFTREQKLAWARENGVSPPTELLATDHDHDADEHDDHEHLDRAENAHNCCESKARCAKTDARDCCSGQAANDHDVKRGSSTTHNHDNSVLGLRALGCKGIPEIWLALTAVMPLVPSSAISADAMPGEWLCLADATPSSTTLVPEPPPPRSAAL
jgi:hypothetical protein